MWELDHKESWVLKNWCFWTVVLEKTFESPLDCKEIQPVHPTGNQSWILIGRTDAEAEALILWPPDMKRRLIREDSMGKIEGRRRRGWQRTRWLDGSPIQWTWVWASSGRLWRTGMPSMLQYIGSDTTEWLNNDKVYIFKSTQCYEFWQLYWPVQILQQSRYTTFLSPTHSPWNFIIHSFRPPSVPHKHWTAFYPYKLVYIFWSCANEISQQIYPFAFGFFHTSLTMLTFIYARHWHPTPVLLPGNSHGRRSLIGCSPWGR